MLALLFIFLPITTDTHRSVPVDRATAWHSSPQRGAQKEDAMLVSITRDGNVFFRDQHILRSELANEIRERMRNGAEKKVYLVVDARARYGDAIPVLAQIRFAGIENVNFLTEKPYR
jgi:biopolymer transport protein ExbD